MIDPVPTQPTTSLPRNTVEQLHDLSRKLEATFLAEMLKDAGFAKAPEALGGGIGEEQFASFLTEAVADEMAAAGGIGLSQSLFEALIAHHGGTPE